jgi:hypothetical protein
MTEPFVSGAARPRQKTRSFTSSRRTAELRKERNLAQKNVSTPAGDIFLMGKNVATPLGDIFAAKKNVSTRQGEMFPARKNVSTAPEDIVAAGKNVSKRRGSIFPRRKQVCIRVIQQGAAAARRKCSTWF